MQIIEVLIKTTAKVRSIESYMIKPNEKEEIFLSTHNDPGLRNMCDGGTYMNSNNENPHVGKKFQKTAVQPCIISTQTNTQKNLPNGS